MSMTEHPNNAHNPEVRFDPRDLPPKAILGSLIALAVFIATVYFIVLGMYKFGDWYERTHQPEQNPMAQPADADVRDINPATARARIDKNFAAPRLETNERIENNEFRLQEEQKLHSYGWVDQQGGAVRIPIDRAMDLIAQRGLNTTPKTGTVPESVTNTIYAAAERADHGEGNSSPEPSSTTKAKGKK